MALLSTIQYYKMLFEDNISKVVTYFTSRQLSRYYLSFARDMLLKTAVSQMSNWIDKLGGIIIILFYCNWNYLNLCQLSLC